MARTQEILFENLAESLVVPVSKILPLQDVRFIIQGFRRQGIACGLSLCNSGEVEVWRERLDGDKPHKKNLKSGATLAGVICVDQKELRQRDIFVVWDRGKVRYEKNNAATQKLLAGVGRW